MSQSLTRKQAFVLGLVVVAALVLGGFGIARIADKQGLWAESIKLTAGFPRPTTSRPARRFAFAVLRPGRWWQSSTRTSMALARKSPFV